jgi:hypothetical protein
LLTLLSGTSSRRGLRAPTPESSAEVTATDGAAAGDAAGFDAVCERAGSGRPASAKVNPAASATRPIASTVITASSSFGQFEAAAAHRAARHDSAVSR